MDMVAVFWWNMNHLDCATVGAGPMRCQREDSSTYYPLKEIKLVPKLVRTLLQVRTFTGTIDRSMVWLAAGGGAVVRHETGWRRPM